MAEASRVLASSMDYAETLQRIARLAVPQIADWCAVDVLGERGEIERVAVHHGDPEQARAGRADSTAATARRLEDPLGVPEVIRSGRARIYTRHRPGRAGRVRARRARTSRCCRRSRPGR